MRPFFYRAMHATGGFTITELLSVSVILVIFFAAFFGSYSVLRHQTYQQGNFYDADRSVRFAVDRVARDVNEALSVVASYGTYNTGDNTLVLALPGINTNGEPTNIETDFDRVIYRLDPGDSTVFQRILSLDASSQRNGGNDATQVVSREVQNILFSSGGTGLSQISVVNTLKRINFSISARKTLRGGAQTQTAGLDSDMTLRNKFD